MVKISFNYVQESTKEKRKQIKICAIKIIFKQY